MPRKDRVWRGKRRFRCCECQTTQRIHYVELSRRTRPRCVACGSVQLEPDSAEAVEDRLIGNLNLLEAKEEEDRGDIVRGRG
jgi:hypothetical protein